MHMKFVFPYLYNPASYILIIAVKVYEFNLFWDCTKAFVKIFNIHNDLTQLIILYDFSNSHTVLWKLILMLVMVKVRWG